MTEELIKARLQAIRENISFFDLIVNYNYKNEKYEVSKKQADIIKELLSLFEDMNWQIAFNSYKNLVVKDELPYKNRGCGTPLKVRSYKKEHGEKTYFGILIGDIPLQISHSVDKEGNLTAERAMYNPLIFIPELKDVVFGCESWWGEIENETELEKLITDETIQNVWYVKMLKEMLPKKED